MSDLAQLPAFSAFAWSTLALSVNLLFTWGGSGGARAKSKTTMNPEDATTVSKGAAVVTADPEAVARGLRVHANAQANILPWFMVASLYVVLGGAATPAMALFGTFVAARWIHSFVYLNGIQPWRTISFVVGALATGAVLVMDVIKLLG